VEIYIGGDMMWPWRRGLAYISFSPRRRIALRGFAAGAVLSLLLVAAPLWIVGSGPGDEAYAEAVPLAALSTAPAASSQFDISAILDGEWVGEMCADDGEPVPIAFEFVVDDAGEIAYSLSVGGAFRAEGIAGSGACDVSGEDIVLHAFLAILNDCDEACGVERVYEGHFEEGALVGRYNDEADEEHCASCVGGGSWWLAPESG
jgi:hypothetical protein